MNLNFIFNYFFEMPQYFIYSLAFAFFAGLISFYFSATSLFNLLSRNVRSIMFLTVLFIFLGEFDMSVVEASLFAASPKKLLLSNRKPNMLQLIIGTLLFILLNNEKLEIITPLAWIPTSLLVMSVVLIASGIGILPLGLIGELISFVMVLSTTNILAKFSTSGNNIIQFGPVAFKYKLSLQEKKEYADSLLNGNSPKIDANYNKIITESESYIEIKEKVLNWLLKKQEKTSIFDYLTSDGDTRMWLLLGTIALVGISYLAIHYFYLSESTIAQGEMLDKVNDAITNQSNVNQNTEQVTQTLAITLKNITQSFQNQIEIVENNIKNIASTMSKEVDDIHTVLETHDEIIRNTYTLLAKLKTSLATNTILPHIPEIPVDEPKSMIIFLAVIITKTHIQKMHTNTVTVQETIENPPPLILKLESQQLGNKTVQLLSEKLPIKKKGTKTNISIEELPLPAKIEPLEEPLANHSESIKVYAQSAIEVSQENVIVQEKLTTFKHLHKIYSQLYHWAIANPGLALALGISTTVLIAYLVKYGKKEDTLVIAPPVTPPLPLPPPTTNLTLLHFSPTLGITLPDIIPKSLPGFTRKYSTTKEIVKKKKKINILKEDVNKYLADALSEQLELGQKVKEHLLKGVETTEINKAHSDYYKLIITKNILLNRGKGEYFITLTFDPKIKAKNISEFLKKSLNKFLLKVGKYNNVLWSLELRDMQNIIKNNKAITTLEAAHFHLLLETNEELTEEQIMNYWTLGNVKSERINDVKRVIKYILKDQFELNVYKGILFPGLETWGLIGDVAIVIKTTQRVVLSNLMKLELEKEFNEQDVGLLKQANKLLENSNENIMKQTVVELIKKRISEEKQRKFYEVFAYGLIQSLANTKANLMNVNESKIMLQQKISIKLFDTVSEQLYNNRKFLIGLAENIKEYFIKKYIMPQLHTEYTYFEDPNQLITLDLGERVLELICLLYGLKSKDAHVLEIKEILNDLQHIRKFLLYFPEQIKLIGLSLYTQLKDYYKVAINFEERTVIGEKWRIPFCTIKDITEKEKQSIEYITKAKMQKRIGNSYLPKLVPPPDWERLNEENFTGGLFLNKHLYLTPLVNINPKHGHQLSIYKNSTIIPAINKLQQSPHLVNWTQASWLFTEENPEYLSEEHYKEAKELSEKETLKGQLLTQNTLEASLNKLKVHMSLVTEACVSDLEETYTHYEKQSGIKLEFPIKNYIIYFPTGIDFRGRFTPKTILHYIGSKSFRSCLTNSYEYALDIDEFHKSLVSRYSKKACTWEEQQKLIKETFINLTESKISELIKHAKEPELFHVAINVEKEIQQGNLYTSYIMYQDCTSSVAQIQNMFVGNAHYKESLNLIKTDIVGSIYTDLGNTYMAQLKLASDTEYQDYLNQKIKLTPIELDADDTLDSKKIAKIETTKIARRVFIETLHKLGANKEFFINKFMKFLLMQSAYGGTLFAHKQKMKELCQSFGIVLDTNIQAHIILDAYQYLHMHTSQLTLLQMCNEISKVYKKHNLAISFHHYSGAFVTTFYKKYNYTRIYRNTPVINYHKPVFASTIKLRDGDGKLDHNKQKNAIVANFIQAIDSAQAHELSIQLALPGATIHIIHDSFGTTTTQASLVRNCLRNFNYKLFTNKNPVKLMQYSTQIEFEEEFRETPLLYNFFKHFLSELKLRGATETELKELENRLQEIMLELKKSADYSPLDFQLLLDGFFVAPA